MALIRKFITIQPDIKILCSLFKPTKLYYTGKQMIHPKANIDTAILNTDKSNENKHQALLSS